MLLVNKASVTMPCETHVLRNLKISMAVCILAAKGTDSILCYPGCAVDATRWRLSQVRFLSRGNGISASGVCNCRYLPRKFMNINGCRISFHSSSESQRLNGSSDRY